MMIAGGMLLVFVPAQAEEWSLPAWSGGLHGQLVPFGENGPRFTWTFTPGTPSPGVRTFSFGIESPSAVLHAFATLDAVTGDGFWQIKDGHIDTGTLLMALAPALGKTMAGLLAQGEMRIIGKGSVRHGRPSGLVKISWQDGKVANARQGWSLDGVSLGSEIEVASLFAGRIPVSLAIRTITTSRFGARNFSMNATVEGTNGVSVKAARLEIAGGEVTAEPFMAPLSPLSLKTKFKMEKVGLQDVAALVPAMLADARGRVDGVVELEWSDATGFQVGEGSISLDEIEPTTLRMAPKPGFLSSRVPARFVFIARLPKPLTSWFSAENPAYVTLTEIELGKADLRVQSLNVRLTPEGENGHDRSATVQVVARPDKAGSVVDKVVFTLNISGPLSQVLKFGISDKLSF